MPRQFAGYEPDAIDCQSLVDALGGDFSCIAQTTVQFTADEVRVTCKVRKLGGADNCDILCQSLVRRPIKGHSSAYTLIYSALLDCWHQLDRGVLATATRPIERGWDGRPYTPRRRK